MFLDRKTFLKFGVTLVKLKQSFEELGLNGHFEILCNCGLFSDYIKKAKYESTKPYSFSF